MFKKRGLKKDPKNDEMNCVLAAVGVMEDELCQEVPLDEINFCLRVDFKQKIKETQLISILNDAQEQGFVEVKEKGWKLTQDGASIVDDYLSSLN